MFRLFAYPLLSSLQREGPEKMLDLLLISIYLSCIFITNSSLILFLHEFLDLDLEHAPERIVDIVVARAFREVHDGSHFNIV